MVINECLSERFERFHKLLKKMSNFQNEFKNDCISSIFVFHHMICLLKSISHLVLYNSKTCIHLNFNEGFGQNRAY